MPAWNLLHAFCYSFTSQLSPHPNSHRPFFRRGKESTEPSWLSATKLAYGHKASSFSMLWSSIHLAESSPACISVLIVVRITPSVFSPCNFPFLSTAPQKASASPPCGYPLTNVLDCVANSLRPRSRWRLNLSLLSCSITATLRWGQSAGFFISLIILRSYSCSLTQDILRRRVASVERAAWKAVATEGKRKPWQYTQQGQSMLRNQQYPWNCTMGGGQALGSRFNKPRLTCITIRPIQYTDKLHQHPQTYIKIHTHPLLSFPLIYSLYCPPATTPFCQQNIIISSSSMKRPTVVNISLHALRDLPKARETPPREQGSSPNNKNPHSREEASMQHLLAFLKIVTQHKGKHAKDGPRGGKEQGKALSRPEREETLIIPLAVCNSVDTLIRKYLLFRAEERPDASRPRPKLPHDRSNNPKPRINKENETIQDQPNDETMPFRSMATLQCDRERLLARNKELQIEAADLRERLKEKNGVILKMVGKENQLRRKYNDELSRLLRNRNIYNISANFEREEEQGEGRMAFNIAGKHIAEPQSSHKDRPDEERHTAYTKSQLTPVIKTLGKSQNEYTKDGRVRLNKTKAKLHPFRPSKHAPSPCLSPNTQFLKNINKSLPTECISLREEPARQRTELQSAERVNFQLYVNQLESSGVRQGQAQAHLQSVRIQDEDFQALELQGFYNEQSLKQIDAKLKI